MKLLIIFGTVVCSLGCNPREAQKEIPHDQIIREVTDMLHHYHGAMEEGGLEAEFDYLDDSPQFFWVPPGYQKAIDFDSVSAVLRQNDSGLQSINLHWDTLAVFPLRNDLAQFYGIIQSNVTDTAGVTTSGKIVESGLVIKRDQGWKLLNGQSAFFPPS